MKAWAPLLLIPLLGAALASGCGGRSEAGSLEALLTRGWQAYSTGDFDYAVRCFQQVDNAQTATAEQTYSALLGLATTYHLETNPDFPKAREYYGRLGALDSDTARMQSAVGLARIDVAAGNAADGRARLTALIRDSPDSMEADEATIHLADAYFAPRTDESVTGGFRLPTQGSIQRGLETLEGRLASHPHNPLSSSMHMMLANKYIETKAFDKAVSHLLAADKEGIAAARLRSEAIWRVARIAEEQLKDYDLAEQYYARYVKEFDRTTLYYRALKSLERVRALKDGRRTSAEETGGA